MPPLEPFHIAQKLGIDRRSSAMTILRIENMHAQNQKNKERARDKSDPGFHEVLLILITDILLVQDFIKRKKDCQ
jgi:hypothetical protein